MNPEDQGTKYDDNKLRYDLVAPESLEGIVEVLTFGAKKYGDRNWEKGILFSRVFAGIMRHLWAWWRGEDKDRESGLSPLHHAACGIHFLQAYTERGMQNIDDRRKE